MGRAHPTPGGWDRSRGAATGHAGPSGAAGARRTHRHDAVLRGGKGRRRRRAVHDGTDAVTRTDPRDSTEPPPRRAIAERRGAAEPRFGHEPRHHPGDPRGPWTPGRAHARRRDTGRARTVSVGKPARSDTPGRASGTAAPRNGRDGRRETDVAPEQGSPGEQRAQPAGNGGMAQRTPNRNDASKVRPASRRSGNAREAGTRGDAGTAGTEGNALEGLASERVTRSRHREAGTR